MMSVPLVCVTFLYRAHEGHELPWNDPIRITIFNSLIELILLHVECPEIVPLELDSVFESLQALQHSALVQTVAFARISIRLEQAVIWPEHVPSLFCSAFQNYYHEGTHKESSIDHLVCLV